MKLSLEFLGTGTSVGVPAIGCDCPTCSSTDPRNKRLRSSVLVRGYDEAGRNDTTVVIDTSSDFRQQMLRSNVRRLDAVVITHFHADHVCGIDDVRRYNSMQKMVLDCWANQMTLDCIRRSFGYVISDSLRMGWPCLRPREIRIGEAFEVGSLRFMPLDLDHSITQNVGLIITCRGSRPLAYCLDVKTIPPESFTALRGVDTLVLDMLRDAPHPTHMNYEEAMAAVEQIQPSRTFFGHMAHEVEHASFESRMPVNVRLAYDGLVLQMD